MKPIISGSGIRGIFGESLTVEDAVGFAAAFGTLCGRGPVVVGRDTRSSGPAMEAAVSAGLMSVGCSPVHMGVVTTPTVQLEAMREGVVGGIAITSSHNPGEWNALKLIGADGVFLRGSQRKRLMEILQDEQRFCGYSQVGTPGNLEGSLQRHVEGVVSIPMVRKSGRRLRAVLDVTGGTAATFAPMLMEALKVDYSVINPDMLPEGDFPRVAEPTVESLRHLSREVVEMKADIGFAFDPDGDRLALVDQSGRVIGEDYTVALALDYVLEREPGTAVVNLSTSMLARDAAERHGCMLFR
ncbi:MAG: phosphoglucosamine mutase, partial [Candidatus Aegiribacteria sp.]|nr:phosphoglucosamine mutase [Candidatus Aegiribacteria sp.]MBD3294069.1 phosphoglucosamine mutase [Candidatus Fermentibacteria bacterium]